MQGRKCFSIAEQSRPTKNSILDKRECDIATHSSPWGQRSIFHKAGVRGFRINTPFNQRNQFNLTPSIASILETGCAPAKQAAFCIVQIMRTKAVKRKANTLCSHNPKHYVTWRGFAQTTLTVRPVPRQHPIPASFGL